MKNNKAKGCDKTEADVQEVSVAKDEGKNDAKIV
jgi:hypothetical protein